jgi:hypothetical protein
MLDLDQNYKAASEASRRVSGKSNVEVSSDNEAIDDNALAWKMATTDMGIEDPGEVSAVRAISFMLMLTPTGSETAADDAASAEEGH